MMSRFFKSGMPGKTFLICISFLICSRNLFAGIKIWTGNAGDGLWSTASNWNDNIVPSSTDDVLLDNSAVTNNYIVSLPDFAVVIKTISISPDIAKTIQLILPVTNISEPAFTVTGPGYGILINDGGIFLNASGLSSGESLNIADSIKINNGGRYIHHTKASHANNITRLLSTSAGTENGIFEFDVPRASYTVSVSNRTYGSIVFNSTAAGGNISYTCNGTNPLTINGNLEIDEGVNFSVDLRGANGNIFIKGDYIQNGGIFNIASGAGNSTVVSIQGNLHQLAAGQITETNTGFPSIELKGSSVQTISLAGTISNDINFRMNNIHGAVLQSALQLPYKLELLQGKITTSPLNLLTLLNNCSITVDSTSANTSFIDGPLRKEGLAGAAFFLFPVGKNESLRWLELKNATGNYTVEYINNNPRLISNSYGAGIYHISANEYWKIDADANPVAIANVELSFVVPASGPVTDLSYLNVSSLASGSWIDAGHTAVTGSLQKGSIVSGAINNFQYFTLASTANLENPLPIKLIDFDGSKFDHTAILHWQVDLPADVDFFEVMTKFGNDFKTIAKITASGNTDQYQFICDSLQDGINYYRLRVTDKQGVIYLGKIISINNYVSDFTMTLRRLLSKATRPGCKSILRIKAGCNG